MIGQKLLEITRSHAVVHHSRRLHVRLARVVPYTALLDALHATVDAYRDGREGHRKAGRVRDPGAFFYGILRKRKLTLDSAIDR